MRKTFQYLSFIFLALIAAAALLSGDPYDPAWLLFAGIPVSNIALFWLRDHAVKQERKGNRLIL